MPVGHRSAQAGNKGVQSKVVHAFSINVLKFIIHIIINVQVLHADVHECEFGDHFRINENEKLVSVQISIVAQKPVMFAAEA